MLPILWQIFFLSKCRKQCSKKLTHWHVYMCFLFFDRSSLYLNVGHSALTHTLIWLRVLPAFFDRSSLYQNMGHRQSALALSTAEQRKPEAFSLWIVLFLSLFLSCSCHCSVLRNGIPGLSTFCHVSGDCQVSPHLHPSPCLWWSYSEVDGWLLRFRLRGISQTFLLFYIRFSRNCAINECDQIRLWPDRFCCLLRLVCFDSWPS